jgi:hypothetical protein
MPNLRNFDRSRDSILSAAQYPPIPDTPSITIDINGALLAAREAELSAREAQWSQ